MTEPTTTEQATVFLYGHWLSQDDAERVVQHLLAQPDLLADLAIEAGGLEQTTGCEECGDRPLPGAYGVPENPCGLCGSPELFKRRTRKGERDGD